MNRILLALALICLSSPVQAEEAKSIGTYGDWTAYSFQDNGAKSCYMAATPQDAKGDYTKRGNVYAMITHRPKDKTFGVFSYLAGYTYAKGAKVTASIDGTVFTLVGQDETAWTPNDETDAKLSDALRHGTKMVVEGVSAKGTATKDVFSLKGSGSAYDAISKACGVSK